MTFKAYYESVTHICDGCGVMANVERTDPCSNRQELPKGWLRVTWWRWNERNRAFDICVPCQERTDCGIPLIAMLQSLTDKHETYGHEAG